MIYDILEERKKKNIADKRGRIGITTPFLLTSDTCPHSHEHSSHVTHSR